MKSEGPDPDWMTLHFGKWAFLTSSGPLSMFTPKTIQRLEAVDRFICWVIWKSPLNYGFKIRLANWWTWNKRGAYGKLSKKGIIHATHIFVEAYNHEPGEIYATVRVWRKGEPEVFILSRFLLPPGYSYHNISLGDRFREVSFGAEYFVRVSMDAGVENARISFREFCLCSWEEDRTAKELAASTSEKMIKCVVWDLDNTIWEGTLIEDGLKGIHLRPWVRDVIEELDARGILQSVVSKNNHEDAMAALKEFKMDHFFLYPQISWEPKSISIQRIREKLNIGLDAFCFIDDQPFERAEVATALPEVDVLPDTAVATLVSQPRFQCLVSKESRQRRKYYLEQIEREESVTHFSGDYTSFLKSCQVVLSITDLDEFQLERVYELTQRTNQMNFSGARYSRDDLRKIAADLDKETFVMSCRDRFGFYGIIGFAVLDKFNARIESMTFSCRIQSKRVEHAFLSHVASKLREQGREKLFVVYKKNEKNASAGEVFEDMFFSEELSDDGLPVRAIKLDHACSQDLVQIRFAKDE